MSRVSGPRAAHAGLHPDGPLHKGSRMVGDHRGRAGGTGVSAYCCPYVSRLDVETVQTSFTQCGACSFFQSLPTPSSTRSSREKFHSSSRRRVSPVPPACQSLSSHEGRDCDRSTQTRTLGGKTGPPATVGDVF